MKRLIILMTILSSYNALASLDYAKKYFKSGSDYINFNYFYGITEDESYPLSRDNHNFQLDFLNRRHAFLYGLGVRYMTASDAWGGEVFANILVHFAELKDRPMSLGNAFAFAPYTGVQVGIGYHRFNGAERLDTFASRKTSTINRVFHNYMVMRFVLGIKFPLNKDFALDVAINKNMTMERTFGIGTGVMLKF